MRKINKNSLTFLFSLLIVFFALFPAFSKKNDSKKARETAEENPFRAKTFENTIGNVRILAKGTVGSFQMYAVGLNGSQTPILAGYDEFTSSFLSLLAGKKEYKLTDNTGIAIGARRTERGVQLFYSVPDVAWVLYSFDSVNQDRNLISSDIVKVSVTVMNKGKQSQTFALKAVYDTVLGELFGPHFSTNEEVAINSERQFRRFDKVKWLKSENSKVGLQFLLSGADITSPEVVSLSNKDLLSLQKWIPQVMSSRTFDSVLSYNNSAVCMNFEQKRLEPEEQFVISYYIAVSHDGVRVDGEKYIDFREGKLDSDSDYAGSSADKAYLMASELYIAGKYLESYSIVKDEWKNEYNRTDRLSSLKKMLEQKLGLQDVNASESDVPLFSVDKSSDDSSSKSSMKNVSASTMKVPGGKSSPSVSPDVSSGVSSNIDAAYVKSLIEKIQALQDDGENVNRDELIKLSAELDVVTKQLERQ